MSKIHIQMGNRMRFWIVAVWCAFCSICAQAYIDPKAEKGDAVFRDLVMSGIITVGHTGIYLGYIPWPDNQWRHTVIQASGTGGSTSYAVDVRPFDDETVPPTFMGGLASSAYWGAVNRSSLSPATWNGSANTMSAARRDAIITEAQQLIGTAYCWYWGIWEDSNENDGSVTCEPRSLNPIYPSYIRCDGVVQWVYERVGFNMGDRYTIFDASPYPINRIARFYDAYVDTPSSALQDNGISYTITVADNSSNPTFVEINFPNDIDNGVYYSPCTINKGNFGTTSYRGADLAGHTESWKSFTYWQVTGISGSGGSISPSGSFAKNNGTSQTFTASPNANYVVNQWLVDGSVVQNGSNSYTLSNITMSRNVQVTFGCTLTVISAYGGAWPGTDTNVLYGTTISAGVTNSPIVSGTTQYVCKGWSGTGSVPAGGISTNTGSFTITNNSTLVWLWTTNYLMDTATNGNGTVNVPDGWWPKGSNVQITATADEHYHFAAWSGQTNGCTISSNVITVPMTTPRAITASFVVDQHSLIVTTPYGKASPSAGTNWFNWNGSVAAALTNSPVLNGTTQYVCTGWTGTGSLPPSGTGTNTGLFTLTNNSSIAWQWATNYWLDTVTNGNGTVNQADQWCRTGSNIVITATPSGSNRFTGWTGQTNGCSIVSNQITVSMTTPRQISASFIRQYGLFVSTPYGQASLPSGTNFFDSGASVTVMITNSPVTIGTTQYVCRGWVGTGNVPASGTATNAGPFTITGDSTITWLWRTNFWMDVGFTGSGSLSTGDCWLASGTNLQVTATPSNHWHFGLWAGDTNGCTIASNKITVLMSGARSVSAGFAIDQHKLIVTTPYGGAWPVAGTNWLDYGSTVTATITNSPFITGTTQYVCRGWTGTGSVSASGAVTNSSPFVLTNDSSIVWNWRTNYWLHVDATGSGSVNTSDVWVASGTNIQVTATPGSYYVFGGWQGQTNGCALASNKITVVINTARDLGAVFIAELATNSVPKWWLAQHSLTNFNADAMSDADLDGLKTWQEYIAGSDPTNIASCFRVTECSRNVIGWDAVSGRVYSVYWATNLLSGFQCLESNIPWTRASLTNQSAVPCGYYKIDVRLE